jgi:hypothetical protein
MEDTMFPIDDPNTNCPENDGETSGDDFSSDEDDPIDPAELNKLRRLLNTFHQINPRNINFPKTRMPPRNTEYKTVSDLLLD